MSSARIYPSLNEPRRIVTFLDEWKRTRRVKPSLVVFPVARHDAQLSDAFRRLIAGPSGRLKPTLQFVQTEE